MRTIRPGCMVLPLLALLGGASVSQGTEPELQPIFNDRDLTGWHVGKPSADAKDAAPSWRVEDGVLVGESDADLHESYLWTDASYGDFLLEFEVRWTGEIDSGVMFREPNLQLQLGTSRSLQRDMTGSFYAGSRLRYPEAGRALHAAHLMRPEGEWNTFRLEARDDTFRVWINGTPAANYANSTFAGAGPIGLQIHAGLAMRVEFRNIRLAAP